MTNWIEISIPALKGRECDFLKECIESNFVSSVGPFINQFENNVSREIGLSDNNAVATSSGTTALQLGLLSIGVKPNELVIVPSYTFIATANAVSHIGANPWILNIESKQLTIDPIKLNEELEKNTIKKNGSLFHKETNQRIACIIPVYVFGSPPDIDLITEIANHFSIPILLDSACGIGSKYKDLKLGQTKLPGIISFNGNKTITTGAGGIFYSVEKNKVEKVRHLSTTAKCSSRYDHDEIGYNYRMSNIQAALGLAQLEDLSQIINQKRIIHSNYLRCLSNFDQFRLVTDPPWGESSHWLNAIILNKDEEENIDNLINELRKVKIRANYFWKPLHLQKPYSNHLQANLKSLDDIQNKILVLPSSSNLKIADQERVINAITTYFYNKQ
jgi:dTDP-4-amino-4,6-dideoxygalactose transaminase